MGLDMGWLKGWLKGHLTEARFMRFWADADCKDAAGGQE
jgi:hypothetical protein